MNKTVAHYQNMLEQLIDSAELAGVVLTIDLQPLPPLRMGGYTMIGQARENRYAVYRPFDASEWARCQAIANLPLVNECLAGFAQDPTGDGGVMVVREVLRAVEPTNREKYLEAVVSASGAKAAQYDIEHPNDGLNADTPSLPPQREAQAKLTRNFDQLVEATERNGGFDAEFSAFEMRSLIGLYRGCKLRIETLEKELAAIAPQGQQAKAVVLNEEPVAYMDPDEGFARDAFIWNIDPNCSPRHIVPVYTRATAQALPVADTASADAYSNLTVEQRFAVRQAENIGASDSYFKARAHFMDTYANRNIFEAGFYRGWDSALQQTQSTESNEWVADAKLTLDRLASFLQAIGAPHAVNWRDWIDNAERHLRGVPFGHLYKGEFTEFFLRGSNRQFVRINGNDPVTKIIPLFEGWECTITDEGCELCIAGTGQCLRDTKKLQLQSEVINFLLGEGELDGLRFPEGSNREPFWWRKQMRKAWGR